MNILFRADSSSRIGTGHIMRDLVLAEQFENANIIFATQDLAGNINHKIKEKNYTIKILTSNDIEELDRLIKEFNIDMIVIDHYAIDYDFEKQLKINNPTLKIMSLDDTYEKHSCDILLNHNIYADRTRYKGLVPEHCELRCGANYTLLREEFRTEKAKRKKAIHNRQNIFIAMGGADHSNLNIKILEVLSHFSDIHIDIVTTTANQHLTALQGFVTGKADITLHINTDKIAKLMNRADLAIVTPSVTLNEILYLEIPFIAIQTADNQDEMYHYLVKNEHLVLEHFNAIDLTNKLENFFKSKQIALVNFTDLSLDEKKMILEWRNHPAIRKWMFTQEKIEINDHLSYVDSLDKREDRVYFLVKQGSQAIGVIDFTNIDHENRKSEFGIYANPLLKGVGGLLMASIIEYAFNILKVETLVSEVFEDNASAIRLYKRYNFKNVETKKVNNKNVIQMELTNENR